MRSASGCPRVVSRRRASWGFAAGLCLVHGILLTAQGPLRKIGEMHLAVVGLSATVEPAAPVVPKNTPAGVRVNVRGGAGDVSSADLARFFGSDAHVEAEFSGPGLQGTVSLSSAGTPDRLLLTLPAVQTSGDYRLANIRVVANDRAALDVTPSQVAVQVIEQVLITSVTTRPLTLEEIRNTGIVLDRDDYLGFEFTMGILLESRPVQISFPVVFDNRGVPLPEFTFPVPQVPSPELDIPRLPLIVPTMLVIEAPDGARLIPGFDNVMPDDIRIPSVLVIPGTVGFLKQFFSAQLFVANGAPGGSGLTVRDVTGTIRLPAGDDAVVGNSDDPLTLASVEGGSAVATLPILGEDAALQPGQQGQAEFLVRGEREGFHRIEFDIAGVLDGLVTGPAPVKGVATGAVLVRNPYFDMTFTVPSVVRRGERLTLFATITNKSESAPANDLTVAFDATRMSGMRFYTAETGTRAIPTLRAGDSKTLSFEFVSDRTGQIVASYLKFDTTDGSDGTIRFTAGIGERGIALSPDTLVLPGSVDALPLEVSEAAMRVLGQAWSIALADAATRPSGVLPIARTEVVQKGVALAEAGLRVTLGQPLAEALRDLTLDFHGPVEATLNGGAVDPGFDQLLRETDAGHSLRRALGAALATPVAQSGGVLAYHRDMASVLASGSDRLTFAATGAPADIAIVDGSGRRTELGAAPDAVPASQVVSALLLAVASGTDPPVLGLVTDPRAGPYTIELVGTGTGQLDLSVALPSGDGNTRRGLPVSIDLTPGSRARVTIDLARPDAVVVERDPAEGGEGGSVIPFAFETLAPAGARVVSATVVGPELMPSAAPFGRSALLLLNRVVDPASAADALKYGMPRNAVTRARRVLSGRFVILELQQPEGPYVPATLSVSGVADLRGAIGPSSGQMALESRLEDMGAVVTGRVFGGDGTPVGGLEVFYSNAHLGNGLASNCSNAAMGLETPQSRVRTAPDGSFEFRYVRKDVDCGLPFRVTAQDPGSGSVRRLHRHVQVEGERIVMDLGLFGRGTVTGVVRDLEGQPVGGAHVTVVSDTDQTLPQEALADGTGRYTIPNVLVGAISVVARKAYDNGATIRQGAAAGRLFGAGITEAIDVVIDSGSAAVSGVVVQVTAAGTAPAPGALVAYRLASGTNYAMAAAQLTGPDGAFSFPSVPAGAFQVDATLPTSLRETGRVLGVVGIGETREGLTILVQKPETAIIRGRVRLANGTPVARAMVREDQTFTFTDDTGAFETPPLPVNPAQPHGLVAETPDRRRGTASVLVAAPGVIENVAITLSALGSAEFTVLDGAGSPLAAQQVDVLADGFGLRGACALGCGCSVMQGLTDAAGRVRFTGLPAGVVRVRALRLAGGFRDVAEGTTTIIGEGHVALGVLRFEGFGRIEGLVLDDRGRESVGADVVVYSRRMDQATCSMRDSVLSHTLRTDAQGRFSLASVGVGPVSMSASQAFLPTPVGASVDITRPGEERSVTLRLVNSFAGELSGRVLLPDGITPSGAGVEVTINGPLPDITVRTNEVGEFRFAKILPAGTYRLTALDARTGFLTQEHVYLLAGQDLSREVRLKGRGTVRVRVVDAGDNPVSNAVVTLKETSYPNRTLEGILDDASGGLVMFDHVFEGPIAVEASDIFGRTNVGDGVGGRVAAVVPGPDSTIDVVVRFGMTGAVRGRFLLPDGTGIPFGIVKLFADGREIGQTTTAGTGEVGSFEFLYVPAGSVRLEAQHPGSARTGVAVGVIEREDQILALDVFAQGLGTVTGVVRAGGAPQPAAQIELASGQFKVQAAADGDGRYAIEGVPEGLVTVQASVASGLQKGAASAPLTGDGSMVTIDVAVTEAARLTGLVRPAPGVAPRPTIVTASIPGSILQLQASTDADGRFEFARVPAGRVLLAAHVIGSIDKASADLVVAAGATNDVELQLRGVGGLSGVALDSAGSPTGGTVTVDTGGSTITVTVGVDGAFEFPALLAGPATLVLSVNSEATTLFGRADATVVAGQSGQTDVQLQPSATVIGRVRRPNGQTDAIGADVLFQQAGRVIRSQVLSDGSFALRGVPLGAFTVRITDPFSGGVALLGDEAAQNGQTVDLQTIVLDESFGGVREVDPPDGTVDVAANRPLIVTFTDPLATTTGIEVRNGTTQVFATAALSGDTVTLTPSGSGWPDSAELTIVVKTTATDVHGRHPAQEFTSSFRTVDLSPPRVVSSAPAPLAVNVPANAVVDITFSEPLSDSTNLANLITMTSPSAPVSGSAVRTAPAVVRFTPDTPLVDHAIYMVVTNGAVDAAGNVQAQPYALSFTTLDTVAPALSLQAPGAWTTAARPLINVQLGDAVSGIDPATGLLRLDDVPLAASVSSMWMQASVPDPLAEGQHTIDAAIADRSGNPASLRAQFGVDTVPPSAPVLSGVSAGQVVSGSMTLAALATDATSGVAYVDVLGDGLVIGRLLPPSFEGALTTTTMADGFRTLDARAVDAAGLVSAQGAGIQVFVDNVPMTVSIIAPPSGLVTRTAVTAAATVSEAVARVEFTLGGTTVVDDAAPYEATLPLGTLADGTHPIVARAFGEGSATATASRDILIDRTPPPAPDGTRISAEPPESGYSLVVGGDGAVQGGAAVEISNTASGAVVQTTVSSGGRFASAVPASIDDVLAIVAIDAVGNRSAATQVAVRSNPSLPPDVGSSSLRFEGVLADRVSGAAGGAGLATDGVNDAVFTLMLSLGSGVTRQLQFIDLSGPSLRSTRSGMTVLGVTGDAGGPLLNGSDGTVSVPLTGEVTLTLFAHHGGFIADGATYVATAAFTDGSQFVATFTIVGAADRVQVPHSATIVADPATVTIGPGVPGTAQLTITDIRDIDGTRVPDGARIALAVADMAARDPRDQPVRSVGGEIQGGEPAANNPNFRVFTVTFGAVDAVYASGAVTAEPIVGGTAIVQALGADADGNVIGDEIIAALDLPLRASADRATVHPTPAALFADRTARTSTLRIQPRDAAGNPLPNGAKVLVSANYCATRKPDSSCIESEGSGAILGGDPAPDFNFRLFTVQGGEVTATYSSQTTTASTGQVQIARIQVAEANASGSLVSNKALGTGVVALVGPARARVAVSPSLLTVPNYATVVVDHVHDMRGALVPDGATVLLSANYCATRVANFSCITSDGGAIVDGASSPDFNFRRFALEGGRVVATFGPATLGPTPGQVLVAAVQAAAGRNDGAVVSTQALGSAQVRVAGATDALGSADPPAVFSDGSLRTTTVTFDTILDGFGNRVPDGTRVLASADYCAARHPNASCIVSEGGQILNGASSPTSGFRLFTVAGGTVAVQYGDQGLATTPGQIREAAVALVPANASGGVLSSRALGHATVQLVGTTSAQVTTNVSSIFADGSDRRAVVTISNIRDAAGRPVPEGTLIGVSAAPTTGLTPNGCCWIASDGGTIAGGSPTTLGNIRAFPVVDGQVVVEYSAQGISVGTAEKTAGITVFAVTASGSVISQRVIGSTTLRLVGQTAGALVALTPANQFADGRAHLAQVVVSNLRDAAGNVIPDGTRVALTASPTTALTADGCCWVPSIGGVILPAGTSPGDGAPAANATFKLFTVAGGEVRAVYSAEGLVVGRAASETASVAVVPAAQDGTILTLRSLGVGPISLHGPASAVASGPATLASGGATGVVTFSGIKDAAGNTVPDGTLVGVGTADFLSCEANGSCYVRSTGGTILDGTQSTADSRLRLFTVTNGAIAVTYSTQGAAAGTARVQLRGASSSGASLGSNVLAGGVWAITIP